MICFVIVFQCAIGTAQVSELWLEYQGSEGIGKGKNIVLISGDEEYRSEETMPMLAKILSQRYGFNCTVLFSINPETGYIDPNYRNNIPGMHFLEEADLVIMLIRFRELPDEQMRYFDRYVQSGKPIIGLRTATHAFNYSKNSESPYVKYDWRNNEGVWVRGFGGKILGDSWVSHHGVHGKEGSRGLINGRYQANDHPVLRGVKDIWGPSDVYTIQHLPKEADVLVYGIPTENLDENSDLLWEKSVMPMAWTIQRKYGDSGVTRIFTTTMGSSVDFKNRDLRRLLINAGLWCLEMDSEISGEMNVDYIDDYHPTMFGFGDHQKEKRPDEFK